MIFNLRICCLLQRLPSPLSQLANVMMLGTTKFTHQKCVIKSATGKTLLQTPKIYGLYRMDNELPKNQAYQSLTAVKIHKKLGHISQKTLKHLLKHGMILGIELDSMETRSLSMCVSNLR